MKRILSSLVFITLTGCMKVGPYNLHDDSIRYNYAVHNSVDQQLLLNIVRLRYRDNPAFLQVGTISSAYEFKRTGAMDARFDLNGGSDAVTLTPKVGMDYSEKPNFTLSPLRGENFSKEMLSPVSLRHIMLLHTSGWKIDRILRTTVQRMNNLKNAPTASGPTPMHAPEYKDFIEFCQIMRELEMRDEIRIVSLKNPDNNMIGFYILMDDNGQNRGQLSRVWELLDLEPGTTRIHLVPFHGKEHKQNEVTIDTRSPLSVLYFLSTSVNAPGWDQAWGRVTVTTDAEGNAFHWDEVLGGIMNIQSTCEPVCQAAVSVKYRGVTFYIDDSDLNSKSTFMMMTQLLALQTNCPEVPVLTLPLQN